MPTPPRAAVDAADDAILAELDAWPSPRAPRGVPASLPLIGGPTLAPRRTLTLGDRVVTTKLAPTGSASGQVATPNLPNPIAAAIGARRVKLTTRPGDGP